MSFISTTCIAALLLATAATATAAEPLIFLGDNNTSATYLHSPRNFTKMGDHVYFSVNDNAYTGLYRTGDTPGTVELIKHDLPSFSSTSISTFGVANNTLFFAVLDEPLFTWQLWKSDGSSSGTVPISGVPSLGSWTELSDNRFASTGAHVLFATAEGKAYKSDGTNSGTTQVLNLTGSGFTTLDDTVYFRGSDGTDGGELWRTDGSDAGTSRVKDINPGTAGSNISGITNINGDLYFTASDAGGPGLWKSDGTEVGTYKIASGQINTSSRIVGAGGYIYFVIGHQLWKSNGVPSGAEAVLDATSIGRRSPKRLTSDGVKVYFTLDSSSGSSALSLWASDGTLSGTTELTPGSTIDSTEIIETGGKIYFSNRELWTTDGTVDGTTVAVDLNPDSYSYPLSLTSVDDKLYFLAQIGPVSGAVLKLDPATNELVVLSGSNTASSFEPRESVRAGDKLYFSSWDGIHGWELWVTDGTPGGTLIVKDGIAGSEGLNPTLLRAAGETIYFFSRDFSNQMALWKSDGTALGTQHIADIPGNFVRHAAVAGGELYFSVNSTTIYDVLWRTDGTSAGTYIVSDKVSEHWLISNGEKVFFGGQNHPNGVLFKCADPVSNNVLTLSNIDNNLPYGPYLQGQYDDVASMVEMSGIVYFDGLDNTGSRQLYRTDGSVSGTQMLNYQVRSTYMPVTISEPAAGRLLVNYRSTNDLFISDGTETGTVLIGKNYTSFLPDNAPIETAPLGDKLVYISLTESGYEPWVTDGTASGTVLLKDTLPGNSNSGRPTGLTPAGDVVYFTTNDGTHGYELWRTDGTPEGTKLVKDIKPGPGSSFPQSLTFAGGKLHFSADDGVNGRELWTIATGQTEPVMTDIAPGPTGGTPGGLYYAAYPFETLDDTLIMEAFTPATGMDLWALPLQETSSVEDWALF